MSVPIVVQVSDTHLSPSSQEFNGNWDIALETINALNPDLVVHTGDLNCHDPDSDRDQDFAKAQMDRLAVPWIAIPGNHDVGDGPPEPVMGQEVTAERCEGFRRRYGQDRWARDLGDWTLVGLNSLIFGNADGEEQWDWLADTLRARKKRKVALFIHKPPFLANFSEEQESSRTIPRVARARLASVIVGSTIAMVASGHCHEYRHYTSGTTSVVWAPSTAFILKQGTPFPTDNYVQAPGFVIHAFGPDGHSHRLEQPGRLTLYDNALFHLLRAGANHA